MKRSLKEQLERIHRLNYGDNIINEGFLDNIISGVKKANDKIVDKTKSIIGKDEKKADKVSNDVSDFYKTLETASEGNGITQQEKGSMSFQKEVESMQIGLMLLGYDLPKYGVDGLFGSETAQAIEKFKSDHKILNESASQLRTVIKDLGYVEKSGQLDDGGELKGEIAAAAAEILKKYKVAKPDVKIRITAGNDSFHHSKKIKYDSPHKHGNAIDMVIEPYSNDNLQALINVTKECQKKFPKLTFIDEYNNPSSAATGKHFHIQIGGKQGKEVVMKSMVAATPELLKKLITLLKSKNIKSSDIDKYTNIGSESGGKVITTKGRQLLNDPTFKEGLKEISNRIKVGEKYIINIMNLESELDPSVRNTIGCVGLIQFCHDGNKGIKKIGGTTYNLEDLRTNLPLQLKAIKDFWGVGYDSGKIVDPVSLYIYNFFPLAAGKSDDFVLQSPGKPAELVARQNPTFNSTLGRPKNSPLTVGILKQYYSKVGMI